MEISSSALDTWNDTGCLNHLMENPPANRVRRHAQINETRGARVRRSQEYVII